MKLLILKTNVYQIKSVNMEIAELYTADFKKGGLPEMNLWIATNKTGVKQNFKGQHIDNIDFCATEALTIVCCSFILAKNEYFLLNCIIAFYFFFYVRAILMLTCFHTYC